MATAPFSKLLEVARFSLRDVTMAKIVRTNKLASSPPWWPYDTRRKQSKCIHFLDFLYFPIYSRRNYSVGTNTSFSWFQVIHFKPLTFLKNCCSKSLSTFECWVSFLDLESIKVPNQTTHSEWMVWHFYADKEWYISILVYFCQLKSNLIIKKTNLNHSKCAKSSCKTLQLFKRFLWFIAFCFLNITRQVLVP